MSENPRPSSGSPLGGNPPLLFSDIEVGRVLWLPPKAEAELLLRRHGEIPDEPATNMTNGLDVPNNGFYNHPILVLNKCDIPSTDIHFLLVRSFADCRC